MTVRTRKTITDLIQQLKVQEKDIKSQLSDSQRRLNEVRDRISTCYWVIDQTCETIEEENTCGFDPEDCNCAVCVELEDYEDYGFDLENYCGCDVCQAKRLFEEDPFADDENRRLTWDDYKVWKEELPYLDEAGLEKQLIALGYLMPLPEIKQIKKTKVKAKKKVAKKSTKKGKK